MKTSTKSLPPSLQALVRKLGKFPKVVSFGSTSAAFIKVNTASFDFDKFETESMVTVDPDSRGSYMGDDGESWYETFTEFHGPVAFQMYGNISVGVPNAPEGMSDEAFLAQLNENEGVTMNTEPITKAPKSANPAVLVALDGFVEYVQSIQPKGSRNYTVELVFGKKFVKVTHGSSVHCFVDLASGDVLKAASWKAPAEHARGNILGNNPANYGVTWTGANYLR